MHTQMYMHQHICGPTHANIHAHTDTTYVWKRKKKKEVNFLSYTCLRERPSEHNAATSGVNEALEKVCIHGRGWVTFSCRDNRVLQKTEEARVPSMPSYLSITMDSFKFCTLWVQKTSLCHSTLSRIKWGAIHKCLTDSWQPFIKQTSYQEPHKMQILLQVDEGKSITAIS